MKRLLFVAAASLMALLVAPLARVQAAGHDGHMQMGACASEGSGCCAAEAKCCCGDKCKECCGDKCECKDGKCACADGKCCAKDAAAAMGADCKMGSGCAMGAAAGHKQMSRRAAPGGGMSHAVRETAAPVKAEKCCCGDKCAECCGDKCGECCKDHKCCKSGACPA